MQKRVVLLFVLLWALTGCTMSKSIIAEVQSEISEVRGITGKGLENEAHSLVQISRVDLGASCEYATIRDGKIYGCYPPDEKKGMQMCVWDSATGKTLEERQIVGDIEPKNLGLFPAMKAFLVDNNGFYYLWYGMSVPCAEVYEDGEADVYTALDRRKASDTDTGRDAVSARRCAISISY